MGEARETGKDEKEREGQRKRGGVAGVIEGKEIACTGRCG